MTWNYRCPLCNRWQRIDWFERHRPHICTEGEHKHMPPLALEQQDAYVDGHDWPIEIESIVISLRGRNCSVPRCGNTYKTLVHHVPWVEGGRTSVENLYPVCHMHNGSKNTMADRKIPGEKGLVRKLRGIYKSWHSID